MTGGAVTTVNLRSLLEEMIERDASDLHIVAGERPKLRVDGDITNSSVDHVLTPKEDRKSTRLNSSHPSISYAVFCLKKKKKMTNQYLHYIQKISMLLHYCKLIVCYILIQLSAF